jgi:hypothetical protein
MKLLLKLLIFICLISGIFSQSTIVTPSSDTTLTTKKLIGRLNTTTASSTYGSSSLNSVTENQIGSFSESSTELAGKILH